MLGILKMNKYRKLENPCLTCLVRPVCNKWGGKKYGYYEKRVRYLRLIQLSMAPIAVALCFGIIAAIVIMTKDHPPDATMITGVGGSICLVIFVIGFYLDTHYLHDKFESVKHELDNAIFERDWE